MSARVEDSSLGRAPFATEGASLAVSMDWYEGSFAEAGGPEEMVAVLDGAISLETGEERHALTRGQGVLIPEGTSRRWSAEGSVLLYRVKAR